jgi:hypothetical protein
MILGAADARLDGKFAEQEMERVMVVGLHPCSAVGGATAKPLSKDASRSLKDAAIG